MRIFIYFLTLMGVVYADIVPANIMPTLQNSQFMQIKILDQKQLSFQHIQGVKFAELSDATYDESTKTLYFVGDKGSLFAFRAVFSKKIDTLHPLRATRLKTKKGKKLKKWKRDSEGLTLDGGKRLLVSFEETAKIAWFHKNSNKFGNLIQKYKLPSQLMRKEQYRSKNKLLEALAWHPKYGIVTATEWPLLENEKKKQTIYALSKKRWHFKAEPERKTGVVSMEVMDDGNVLVMERSYVGLLYPFIITLKKVFIKNCKQKMCKTEILAKFNSHEGWSIDNFEGLAKVGKNRYVMVSDDNENFFQKTLLVYFEVI